MGKTSIFNLVLGEGFHGFIALLAKS